MVLIRHAEGMGKSIGEPEYFSGHTKHNEGPDGSIYLNLIDYLRLCTGCVEVIKQAPSLQ